MLFTDIRLQNFRSYKDASFEIGPGVTIVVGPNAAGKTNLIEALMLAALGKTYKNDNGFARHDSKWARVDVHTSDNEVRTVKIKKDDTYQKEFVIEEKIYKRLPQSKQQPIVLFEPNDLMLIHGDPSGRRKFIDNILAQTSGNYRPTLNKYKRILAQRNALLKSLQRPDKQLFMWDIKLTEQAAELVRQRLDLVEQINKKLAQTYSIIAKTPTQLNAKYQSTVGTENYSANLLKNLEKSVEKDMARGFTGLGPHRDDLVFEFGDKQDVAQASRGETRSLVLSLKLIELGLLEEKRGVKPLLLLDDVFSELDGQRRKTLTNYLDKYQTVITTTDADVVIKNFLAKCHIIALQNDNHS